MNNDRDFHSILWFAVVIEENGAVADLSKQRGVTKIMII